MRVEHYRRLDTGWEMETLIAPRQAVAFKAIACGIGMADACFGVDLDALRG